MDGTLTRASLDFDAIRAEMGISEGTILEYLEAAPEEERRRGFSILERHEEEAARTSELNPGVTEALAGLAARAIKTALITRNSRRSTDATCAMHGMSFDAAVTRDEAAPKPSAEPLLLGAGLLGIPPVELLIVGDHRYDLEAGREAGVRSVLFLTDASRRFLPLADYSVERLAEVVDLVDRLNGPGCCVAHSARRGR